MDKPHIYGPTFSTFVRAVMLCCEEKGIDYGVGLELKGQKVPFKSEAHLAMHPHGKVPVLLVGDRMLFETCTICRYLDAAWPGTALQPKDLWQRALVDQACAEISLYVFQALVVDLLLEFAFPKGSDGSVRMGAVEQALPAAAETIRRLEDILGDREFIAADEYTIADALLIPIIDYLAETPVADRLFKPDSALNVYLARMRARESSQKVLTHG